MRNEAANLNTTDATEPTSYWVVRLGQVGRYRVVVAGTKLAKNEVIMIDTPKLERAEYHAKGMNQVRDEVRKGWGKTR